MAFEKGIWAVCVIHKTFHEKGRAYGVTETTSAEVESDISVEALYIFFAHSDGAAFKHRSCMHARWRMFIMRRHCMLIASKSWHSQIPCISLCLRVPFQTDVSHEIFPRCPAVGRLCPQYRQETAISVLPRISPSTMNDDDE
jgi:hypothetical protein